MAKKEVNPKKEKHPGFTKVSAQIAKKQGISQDAADAILANAGRNASKGAKKKNPRLNKIKGKGK